MPEFSGCFAPHLEMLRYPTYIAAILTFLPCLLHAQGGDLLVNGGFEQGATGWDGWGSLVRVEQGGAAEGEAYAHFQDVAGIEQGPVAVRPGTAYVLSLWVRIDAMSGSDWGGIRVAVSEFDWSFTHEVPSITPLTHTVGRWHRVVLRFTSRTGMIRVHPGFFGGKGWVVSFSMDGFSLMEDAAANIPPVIDNVEVMPGEGAAPLVVRFSIEASDADGSIQHVHVEPGDGSIIGGEFSFTHTFETPGAYIARFTVVDDEGATDTASRRIVVTGDGKVPLRIVHPIAEGDTAFVTGSVAQPILGWCGEVVDEVFWINTRNMRSGFAEVKRDTFFIDSVPLLPGGNTIEVQAMTRDGAPALLRLRVECRPPGFTGPRIENLEADATTVSRHQRLTMRFDVVTVAENPFLPFDDQLPHGLDAGSGISIDVVWSNGSRELRMPAMYSMEGIRQGDRLLPTGRLRWEARMAFTEAGEWTSFLIARDARGETRTIGPGVRVLADSVRSAQARVSLDDNRYFESGDGRSLFLLGYNTAVSTAGDTDEELRDWTRNGVNFGRFWLSPVSPFSESWSVWATHHTMANNGYMPPPLLRPQRFNGGDFAWRIAAPAVDNVNTPAMFRGFWDGGIVVKADTRYRILARVRTSNMRGVGGVRLKRGGWLGTDVVRAGVGEAIGPAVRGAHPWFWLVADITTGATQTTLGNLYLVLEDCEGEAWLDQLTLQEIHADGTVGDNMLSKWCANSHYRMDPLRCMEADYMIAQAHDAGVMYKVVIHEKDDYICNHIDRSGLATERRQSFADDGNAKLRRLYEYYWRHLIARWGYASSVHSWELVNEAAPGAMPDLLNSCARFFDTHGPTPRMVSTSFWSEWLPKYWKETEADYADIHAYVMTTGWIDTITIDGVLYDRAALKGDAAAAVYAYAVTTGLDPLRDAPVIHGEIDLDRPGDQAPDPALARDSSGIWLHNFNWAHIAHGGGTALIWNTDNIQRHKLHRRYRGMRAFMKDIPLARGGYGPLRTGDLPAGVRVWGQAHVSGSAAHMWIQNTGHTWSRVVERGDPPSVNAVVELRGFQSRPVQVEWWDSWAEDTAAFRIDTVLVNASGVLPLRVDDLVRDVAVKVHPVNVAPTSLEERLASPIRMCFSPQPVSDRLVVHLTGNTDHPMTVLLTSILGRQCFQQHYDAGISDGLLVLDVHHLPPGWYILVIRAKTGIIHGSFVKH